MDVKTMLCVYWEVNFPLVLLNDSKLCWWTGIFKSFVFYSPDTLYTLFGDELYFLNIFCKENNTYYYIFFWVMVILLYFKNKIVLRRIIFLNLGFIMLFFFSERKHECFFLVFLKFLCYYGVFLEACYHHVALCKASVYSRLSWTILKWNQWN